MPRLSSRSQSSLLPGVKASQDSLCLLVGMGKAEPADPAFDTSVRNHEAFLPLVSSLNDSGVLSREPRYEAEVPPGSSSPKLPGS